MKTIHRVIALAWLVAALFLTSCGGGGGGGGGTPPPATYSISGTVNGAATSGVTIALSGISSATTTTGAGGTYTLSKLANGNYTVTPSLTGYFFTPTSISVSVNNANGPATNFTATAAAPTSPGAGTGSGAGGHGPSPVVLGTVIGAGTPTSPTYVILAKTGVSTTGTTAVTGDIGLSPAAATFLTGFSLVPDPATACFSTSTYVTGNLFAANYNTGSCTTPALLTTAVSDMMTAYTDAAGRASDFTEIGAGNIGGMTLPAGTYKWSSGILIPTDVTLSGTANDVWIFQIAGGLTQASATTVHLTGGAVAKNVFWQVANVVDIGTTAHMEGVILAQTAITLKTGATANSRLLAQSAVTLQANAVTQPAP